MATLYRKYRPQIFDEVIGQDHVVLTLKNALEQNRVAHAYLFCGPRGVGKTTVARILAKAVNCLQEKNRPCGKCRNCVDIMEGKFIDLIEIDAASNRGIDEIRELRDKVNFAPSVGRKKVYIIDEVHMLTREAVNALLKTLEEPPEHSIFIFATTEAHKLLDTLISRCQRFDFHLGSHELLKKSIKKVAEKENLKISDEIIDLIVKSSGGSYRDAQSLLGQIAPNLKKEISLNEALNLLHLTGLEQVLKFVSILEDAPASKAFEFIDELNIQGTNFEEFLSQLIFQLRLKLIEGVKSGADVSQNERILARLVEAVSQMKVSPIDSLPLELAAIDICDRPEAESQISRIKNKELRIKDDEEKNKTKIDDPPLNSKFLILNSKKPDGKSEVISEKKSPVVKKDTTDKLFFSSEERMAIIEGVAAKNKPLGSLLGVAVWENDGGSIKILVEYPLYKDKIMSKNSLTLLEDEIETVLGAKSRVLCEIISKKDIDAEIGEVFELAEG